MKIAMVSFDFIEKCLYKNSHLAFSLHKHLHIFRKKIRHFGIFSSKIRQVLVTIQENWTREFSFFWLTTHLIQPSLPALQLRCPSFNFPSKGFQNTASTVLNISTKEQMLALH